MPGPFLWDGSGHANNLQVGFLNPDGSYCKNDGPKNYLANAQIETGQTTGWTLGVTGALTNALPTTTPTFGSGASGNLALSATSTTPLAGTYSLSYASSAATTAGNMVASSAFTVDVEDQVAKPLNFSFSYKATTGTANANWSGTSTSSFGVAIYDVTNSNWIIPSGVFNFTQGIGAGKCTGTFQTSATGTSYRLVVYNANATAGAITMYFDSFFLGPQISASTSGVVSWNGSNASQAITASVTNLAATTNYDSSGAWNGTQFVVPVAGTYIIAAGFSSSGAVTIQPYLNGSVYLSTAKFATASASTDGSGACIMTNLKAGDLISLRGAQSVTITALTMGIALVGSQAGLGAGGVVASRAKIGSAASTTAGNPFNFDSIDFDYTGSITTGATTWKYTAPVSGTYFVCAIVYTGVTASDNLIYKNGSKYAEIANSQSSAPGGSGGTLVQLNAGDYIDFRPQSTATPNATGGATVSQENHISIFLLQGSSTSSSSNTTIAASYYCSTNQSISPTQPLNFDTKEYDLTNSVTTGAAWKYTAPVTGVYLVQAYNIFVVAGSAQAVLYKNGIAYKGIGAESASYAVNAPGVTMVQLNAGDYIDIRNNGTGTIIGGTLATGTTANFSIVKVG